MSRRRKNAQQKALPIVPPCEEDELISSWLARVARFYGYTVADLLDESDLDIRTIDLAAIDIGLTRAPMGLVANLLNISVELLVAHTIKFALPWAVNALAQEAGSGPFGATPPLRVAICPWCLELQRIDRGFSWLRREWVLAWRTICPRHGVRLRESGDGSVAPGWEDFFRRHTRVQQATCSVSVSTLQYELSASSPPRAGETVPLNDRLLQVQNVLAADPTSDREAVLEGGVALAMMVGDILWALTRSDLAFPDRIAYEAFALQAFDSDWRLARRRSSVPADYARFGVMVRHAMMATAEIIAAGATPPSPLCMPRTRSENELALLLSILITPDAEELVGRSSRWPEQSQAALLGDPH